MFDDSTDKKSSEIEKNNINNRNNNNDLIENDDINIEEQKKYKNEKEILKQNQIEIEHNQNYNIENTQIEKFKLPPNLKKTFIVTMILAGLGIILIILGFINAIADATPGGGIMFWILGTIVIIPGGYYSYQFYKAKKATDEYVRQDILDNIPEL